MEITSVLMIDDDPTQVAILEAYFRSLKIATVKGTTNPSDALKYINDNIKTIDLIVSDLQMPKMHGIEFLRHLTSMQYVGNLAIISGVKCNLLDHAARLAKMHNIKFIGQIAKPITKSALDAVFLNNELTEFKTKKTDNLIITQHAFSSAMQNDEILPFYQPKVDVRTGKIVGAEALVRWHKKDYGFVSPETLIEFAEKNGRIEELTFNLFNRTIKSVAEFIKIDNSLVFATNLSPIMASNLALPDQLLGCIKRNGLSTHNFSFEITENNILHLDVTSLEVLSRLRILKFDVGIDDFGTGSSNIQALCDFPYSELKIDRSFVSNITTNVFSQETVRAAVSLSRQRGMKTVAEGVEDMRTLAFVKDQGIDEAQGYLFAKALSHDAFMELLLEHRNGFDLDKMSKAA